MPSIETLQQKSANPITVNATIKMPPKDQNYVDDDQDDDSPANDAPEDHYGEDEHDFTSGPVSDHHNPSSVHKNVVKGGAAGRLEEAMTNPIITETRGSWKSSGKSITHT